MWLKKGFIIFVFIIFVSGLLAHPASEIKINFNSSTKILELTILHDVKNPFTHYIDKVMVMINGKNIITQIFTVQTDKKEQKAIYIIPDIKKGDKLKVKAYCNISGVESEEIVIE